MDFSNDIQHILSDYENKYSQGKDADLSHTNIYGCDCQGKESAYYSVVLDQIEHVVMAERDKVDILWNKLLP